ncbi:uncharacterized protein IL334_006587 [Kwoniella shivajii]|uniref:Uncharacterized protein n=1 Tax=Kwoniella shivajii TaxID=564305 RepID=A0ABZ1D712_9TREE|nr:hypothetical protein IL334_006587 [Kwoniella shivajii]
MSVKFTPGPHPTSLSRSSSSQLPSRTPIPSAQSSPITLNFPRSPSSSSDVTTSKQPKRPSRLQNNGDPEDPERQPLLETRQLNKPRILYSVLSVLSVIILLGLFVGFGGWRLGKGEGGDRWPGSPGLQ